MLEFNKINAVIFWILLIGNKGNKTCHNEKSCTIRFYERQYFKGNYWTLNSSGKWSSSRQSVLKVPYRQFHIKSIRLFCSKLCRWQICPIRTRKTRHLPRRKRCKILTGDNSLHSLRLWGWSNYILGYVQKLPTKKTSTKSLGNITYTRSTTITISTTNIKTKDERTTTPQMINNDSNFFETSTVQATPSDVSGMKFKMADMLKE